MGKSKIIVWIACFCIFLFAVGTCSAEEGSGNPEDTGMGEIIAYFERQGEYEETLRDVVEERLSEYWKVELTDFSLFLNDAYGEAEVESIATINIYLKWDAWNSEKRTKTMLEMYSDDMAVALHETYPDVPIESLCILWKVPYITENGDAAKYNYYSSGEDMYLKEAYGPLYEQN